MGKNRVVSKARLWMLAFLGLILLSTVFGMLSYQYLRQDPVTINIKDAQGYVTTQIIQKKPNETVGQVVAQAVGDEDNYSCDYNYEDKIHSIDNLELNQKIVGKIIVDGEVHPYSSGATTVGDVLKENNITISPVDIVSPLPSETLTQADSNITVSRTNSSTEVKTEIIPYISETVENDDAAYNSTQVLQPGQNGVRSYTEEVIYNNGVEVERHITSDSQTNPVNEIVEVGTNLMVGKPNIQKGDIEAWRPYVIKALELNEITPTETIINRVLRQINTESAGDQNADQELYDVNTLIGQEAKGLMQTTPFTFNAYHFPGYDDVYNGFHNLLAAINYAKEAYGPELTGLGEGHGF